MADFAHLAKFNRTETVPVSARQQPAWQPADKIPPVTSPVYSRDFLVGYLLHYARLCQDMKRKGSAPVLEALLNIDSENGEVYYLLGRQYQLAGNHSEALECFVRAGSLRPDKPDYQLAAVHSAAMLNQLSRALEMVGNVVSAYPHLPEAFFERGCIYEVDENWSRAQRDYEMCARLDPENPVYLVRIASMYRLQKLYKMARRYANKALKLDPGCVEAHEELHQLPFFDQFADFFRAEDAPEAQKDKTSQKYY